MSVFLINPSFGALFKCLPEKTLQKSVFDTGLKALFNSFHDAESLANFLHSDSGSAIPFEYEEGFNFLSGYYQVNEIGTGAELLYVLEFHETSHGSASSFISNHRLDAFRNVLNASPMGFHLYILRGDGRLVFIGGNPAADKMLKLDHSRYIGKTIEEAFPNLAGTEIPDIYRKIAKEGGIWKTESVEYKDDKIDGAFEVFAFRTLPNHTAVMFLEISERKRIEEEMGYTKNLLESVIDQNPSGIIIADRSDGKWRIGYINKEAKRIFGVDFIGHTVSHDGLGDKSNSVFANIKIYDSTGRLLEPSEFPQHRVFIQGETLEWMDYIVEKAQGKRVNVRISGVPIRAEDKTPVAGMLVLMDTTANVRQQEELKYIGRLLEGVFEHDSTPMLIANYPDGVIIRSNDACRTILGVEDEPSFIGLTLNSIQKSWMDYYIDGNPIPLNDHPLSKALRGTRTEKEIIRIVCKDGAERWAMVDGIPIFDEKGDQLAALIVFPDITDLKLTQDSLRESEQRYKQLFESASDGIAIITGNYFAECNKRFSEILGRPRSEIIGHAPEEFSPAKQPDGMDSVEKAHAFISESLTGEAQYFEWIHSKPNGKLINTEVSLSRYELYGEFYVLAILRDVTDRKKMETALKQSEEQLRQSQKLESIGRLAGGIAHDLNNLLTPILGYSDLLLTAELAADNPIYEIVKNIMEAAERAKSLTQQLLAFGRKQTLQMEVVCINNVVENFIKILDRMLRENITIKTHFAKDLKNIECDVAQIEQVVLNLSINSQDAMPGGGIIVIETKNVYLDEMYAQTHKDVVPGNYVMLCISDTGQGIPTDIQEQVFEPFFTTKRKGEGTGLGLSTVYGIIKQHNGHLWMYSEPGKGTTMKIYFPLVDKDVLDKPKPKPAEVSGKKDKRVLLAEDNTTVREMTAELLKRMGYHVEAADSARNALEIASNSAFDLLLTDVIMPQMTGVELYKMVNEVRPGIKVLYMSGYTDNVIAHHGVLDNGVSFLQKPFTTQDLEEKLNKIFG